MLLENKTALVTGGSRGIGEAVALELAGEGFYRQVTQEIRSEIAVPVTIEEKVLAVVCLSSLTPHYFTDEHQRILQIIVQMIARHLAGLLQIERLTDEVRRLQTDVTYRDPNISSYRLGNVIGNSTKAGEIVAAIETVGGTSPKFLINTHYHGDHTGGNENFGKRGALIFSHDNVRDRLVNGYYIREFNMKGAATSAVGLPVVTFSEDISFHLNGDTVHAIHIPHSHTDGDAIIHFSDANVIHAGDVVFNGFYPFIDVDHGGSLKGMIVGVKKILALSDENTKIIPGHGPLTNATELNKYLQVLEITYERLRK